MMKVSIKGMTCGGCKKRVEKALSNLEGVKTFNVDLEKNEAEIDGEVSKEKVKEAIEDLGFDVVSIEG